MQAVESLRRTDNLEGDHVKKSLCFAICLVLLVGASTVPAGAAKKRNKRVERVVEVKYAATAFGLFVYGTATPAFCPLNVEEPQEVCLSVDLEPQDQYVTAEFKDASGQKVLAYLMYGLGDTHETFSQVCGAHAKPARIPGFGGYIQIFFYQGMCDGAPAIATTGTITFTFSNRP